MASKVDQRRLRDGAKAAAAVSVAGNDFSKFSYEKLEELYDVLSDGAGAMQSLDDLGSAEANEAAWSEACELSKRLDALGEYLRPARFLRRIDRVVMQARGVEVEADASPWRWSRLTFVPLSGRRPERLRPIEGLSERPADLLAFATRFRHMPGRFSMYSVACIAFDPWLKPEGNAKGREQLYSVAADRVDGLLLSDIDAHEMHGKPDSQGVLHVKKSLAYLLNRKVWEERKK